jgi:uncharacterized protein YbaA (DUF1428 family)
VGSLSQGDGDPSQIMMDGKSMPFDGKRMICGRFESLVKA